VATNDRTSFRLPHVRGGRATVAGSLLVLAVGCGGGEVQEAEQPAAEPVAAEQEAPEPEAPASAATELFALQDGTLAWGDLHLGMTVREAEAVLERTFGYTRVEGGCAGVTAPIDLPGQNLYVTFESKEPEAKLLGVAVEVTGEKAAVVEAVRGRIPGLEYRPSRQAPEMTEADNTAPLYVLSSDPEQAVVVKPGETVTITYVRCVG
jgi:hypothetical protein